MLGDFTFSLDVFKGDRHKIDMRSLYREKFGEE